MTIETNVDPLATASGRESESGLHPAPDDTRPAVESTPLPQSWPLSGLRPQSPAHSRFSRRNAGDEDTAATHGTWRAATGANPPSRTESPVSSLVSSLSSPPGSPPPGRAHRPGAPMRSSEPISPRPIHASRDYSPLLSSYDGDHDWDERGTPFEARAVSPSPASRTDDANRPLLTPSPSPTPTPTPSPTPPFTPSDSTRASSNWRDPSFQPPPGVGGPRRARMPGMDPGRNPWTSQFRPWQNMMQGGFGIASMIAETSSASCSRSRRSSRNGVNHWSR